MPSMAIFGLMNMSYGNVVARIVLRRETGLLQRIRTTPLPAPFVIAGLLGNALVISALLFVVVHAVGAALYGVALPDDWVATVAVLAVGAASFGALAVAVSTFVPNPESADAVVMATLLPVTFVSGGVMPVLQSLKKASTASIVIGAAAVVGVASRGGGSDDNGTPSSP